MRSDVYKLRIFKNEKQIKFASKKPFGMVVSVEVSCTLLDIKKREIYYENRQPTKKKKKCKNVPRRIRFSYCFGLCATLCVKHFSAVNIGITILQWDIYIFQIFFNVIEYTENACQLMCILYV